jgi:hypothetical protein
MFDRSIADPLIDGLFGSDDVVAQIAAPEYPRTTPISCLVRSYKQALGTALFVATNEGPGMALFVATNRAEKTLCL